MTPNLALHLDRAAFASLARAEADGAAPGAECPRDVAPATATRATKPRVAAVLAVVLAAFGAASLANAGWLHAKARTGQWLLARAWTETQRSGVAVKPWPWADLHPVARLSAPAHRVDMLVVEGANGRALAWAPGHAERSAQPGGFGNAVITGHRDTHFAFLRALAAGDLLVVEDPLGRLTAYRVREVRIVDHRALRLPVQERTKLLTLVTCWPFDGVRPDTPWRYVVVAEAVDGRTTMT
jgi:sortase A